MRQDRRGYLRQLDADRLADWAARRGKRIRLLVRPGAYVFPGAPIALVRGGAGEVAAAIRDATVLAAERNSDADLEFAVWQLVEMAVRALSLGINDPHTVWNVLDRLGAALCEAAPRHLRPGRWQRDGVSVLEMPVLTYDGLVDAMFDEIRQNAAGDVSVLIRMLEVMTAVLGVETRPDRVAAIARHAELVRMDATRDVANPVDLDAVHARYAAFEAARRRTRTPSP